MLTPASLLRLVRRNDRFTSVDLEDTYFHIPIYLPSESISDLLSERFVTNSLRSLSKPKGVCAVFSGGDRPVMTVGYPPGHVP